LRNKVIDEMSKLKTPLFIVLLVSISILTTWIIAEYTYKQELSILSPHLFNSEYSVEKCDELLEIGFYGKVGNLHSDKINSIEEQLEWYDDCVFIAEYLNR